MKIIGLIGALAPLVSFAACAAGTGSSLCDIERLTYFKPGASPMDAPARRIELASGRYERPPSADLSLDGAWELRLQDGRVIPAEVPGSVYTALWRAGITGDPYFGTNDLAAAAFSATTMTMRRRFSFSPRAGARYRLTFEGVADTAEFSLNGKALGSHMGMFGGSEYELRAEDLRKENELVVRLNPVLPSKNTVALQCVRGGHYCNLPSMGIWRSVRLREIPAVEVRRQFVVTRDAERRAMDYRVELESQSADAGELRISVSPVGFEGRSYRHAENVTLAKGANVLRYSFDLPGAELWWPSEHGAQRLYEVTASFGGSSVTDRFGVRTFRFLPGPNGPKTNLYNRVAEVNGRKLFLKGAGWCVPDALLRLDEAQYRRTLDRAKEQHVNFLRAWGLGLIETATFYSICDREGFLVLQEFPVARDHKDEKTHSPLFETAIGNVRRLRNHPSLVVWGGGNELNFCGHESFSAADAVVRTLGRICCEEDGTRDFWLSDPWGGSEHHHISWSAWTPDAFLRHYAARPGVCQNEYGLDTLMNVDSLRRIAPPEERNMFPWRPFSSMAHHTATFNYNYIVPRARRPKGDDIANHTWFGSLYHAQTNLESFVLSSQIAQVYATAYPVYNARTQFPETGMNTYYKLTDVYPGSSWAVVDWFGAPKLAHYALKRAQASLCAAPQLNGHEFGPKATVPFFLLDDAGELGKAAKWTVTARILNRELQPIAERSFEGCGGLGSVRRLGELTSDPSRPLTSPSVLVWMLTVDGRPRSRDFVMLNVYGHPLKCAGFARTSLSLERIDATHCRIRNTGPVAAVGVRLEAGESADKARLEDNFFFLDAGESRTLSVSPDAELTSASALNANISSCLFD